MSFFETKELHHGINSFFENFYPNKIGFIFLYNIVNNLYFYIKSEIGFKTRDKLDHYEKSNYLFLKNKEDKISFEKTKEINLMR